MDKDDQDARTVRLVIVDDHQGVRESLGAALSSQPDLSVVGLAGSVAGAHALILDAMPDVAVLDLHLRDGSARDLVEYLTDTLPELRTIVHAGTLREREADDLFAAGASEVVLKSLAGTDLLAAIRHVSNGSAPPVCPGPEPRI